MSKLDETHLNAFREELKLAAPNLKAIAGGLGAGAGMGTALGALGGAGLGAVKSYREARQRGEGIGSSVAEGVRGALGGVGKGALVGAGLGAAGGAAAGHLRPNAFNGLLKGDTPVLSSAARFGQRQLHGLTGWTPEGGLESIRGGMHEAKGRLQAAHEAVGSAVGDKAKATAQKELELATKGHDAAQKAHDMGLSSIPGIAKSMKNNGVLNTVKADIHNQMSGAGIGSKALMFGLPAVGMAGAVAGQEAPVGEGAGKAESIGSNVGQMAGGLIGSAVPIVGQTLIGQPLGYAGKMVGRGIDRLRGRHPGQETP